MRACVELAKDWRTDKYLRNLEALMIVADHDTLLVLTGNGDVLEPVGEIAAIGSGGQFRARRRAGAGRITKATLKPSRARRWRSRPRFWRLHQWQSDGRDRLTIRNPDESKISLPRRLSPHSTNTSSGQADAKSRGRGGAAQSLAAPAAGRGSARRGDAQEHS